jgi:UDP-N-acetylmuramoyl-tripeptide--D-alanyl-D-alanine ligase
MATPIPRNQARFALSELAAATRGRIAAGAGTLAITGVCTDSRAVEPGNLYVALRGETHDGHRFVAQAFERGAAAALVAADAGLAGDHPLLAVDDTLFALGAIAHAHRVRWGGRVIGVTGSAGKTTTKELIYAALVACGARALRTDGNLNNLIGVPMTLLCLDDRVEVAVLEMGTSARGEIARLAEIARPDVGVVTSVSAAHAACLGSVEDDAEEKAALLAAIAEDGAIVSFADEPMLLAQLSRVRAERRALFGRAQNADVRLVSHALDVGALGAEQRALRMTCELAIRGVGTQRATLSLFGEGPALDVAAAIAVVLAERGAAALPAAYAGIAGVEPVAGRLVPLEGPHGSIVIDDTYNANPASMAVSIAAARELAAARGGRALLVLGDMRELGTLSHEEHAKVGRLAAQPGVALFVASGPEMAVAAASAREQAARAALAPDIAHTDDLRYAAALVLERITPRDVVLVKGSRGMRMERVLEPLIARPLTPAAAGGAA